MNIFLESHREILEKLIQSDIEFLIIGGFAVNYYGYNRTTGDLDIWIKPDNVNRDKLIHLLDKMGFAKDDIITLRQSDFEDAIVFHIWEKPYKVDFLTHISGVDFNEAIRVKELAKIQGLDLPMIDFDHLVLSKMTTKRLRDKADVEELQKIAELKKNKRQDHQT
jgi:predicted nucleotidyltransferase